MNERPLDMEMQKLLRYCDPEIAEKIETIVGRLELVRDAAIAWSEDRIPKDQAERNLLEIVSAHFLDQQVSVIAD